MDAQRRQELWGIVVENFRAAQLALQKRWYNVSVGRSYYATYTAMWVAVGDPLPPHTRWHHEGIVKHFALGQWAATSQPIPRELRKALGTLYQSRLKADYHGFRVTAREARASVATARAMLLLVAEAYTLSQRALQQ